MNRVLLMMSGGRDSLLSACYLIEDGFDVDMISYYNGMMSHPEYATDVAKRVVNRYGEGAARLVGLHNIAPLFKRFLEPWLNTEARDIAMRYPELLGSQMVCLLCHTAMYAYSIAYCKRNGISALADGARRQQGFCIELDSMRSRYESLCSTYGLVLKTPVFELISDVERKEELAFRNFHPKTLEPQCWLGCPLHRPLSQPQTEALSKYYDNELLPTVQKTIEQLASLPLKAVPLNRADF